MCEKLQLGTERCVQAVFAKWGRLVARKGWLVSLLAFVLFAPWIVGWAARDEWPDQLRAWSLIGAEGTNDRKTIDSTEITNFDTASFIFRLKDDSNVLTTQTMKRALEFHDYVLAYNGNRLQNTDCVKRGRCLLSSHPATLFEDATGSTAAFDTTYGTSQAIMMTVINSAQNPQIGNDVSIGSVFGGKTPATLTLDPSTNRYDLQEAKMMVLGYYLQDGEQLSDYGQRMVSEWLARSGNQDLEIVMSSTKLYQDDLNDSVTNDIGLLYVGIVLFFLYGLLMLGTCHPVGCKMLSGLIGPLCTLLGYLASYGFCCVCNLNVSDIHLILPFLLLSIGADNMYVLSLASGQVNPELSIVKKMAHTMRIGGSSVFITSLAQTLAFLVSSTSRFPAVRSFAIFAGMGVFFVFIFQMSLFATYLSYDLDRQRRKKKECCGLCCCKEDSPLFCCGKLQPRDEHAELKVINEMNTSKSGIKRGASTKTVEGIGQVNDTSVDRAIPNKNNPNQLKTDQSPDGKKIPTYPEADHSHSPAAASNQDQQDDTRLYVRGSFLQRCLSEKFAPFVTHKVSVPIIIVVFIALISFAGWGSTRVETAFTVDLIWKDNHKLQRYSDLYDQGFPTAGSTIAYFTDTSIDIRTKQNQISYLKVMRILSGALPCTQCSQSWIESGTLVSWYTLFLKFVNAGACQQCLGNGPACLEPEGVVKESVIDSCLQQFFSSSGAAYTNTTVIYHPTPNRVVTTVSLFTQTKVRPTSRGVRQMKDIRQIAKQEGIPGSFMWAPEYQVLEHGDGFDWEQIVTVISALVIFVVILLLSGSIVTSALVLLNLVLISFNIMALLWYMDLELNLVTMANLILTFGLAFDYSEHIAQGYNISTASPDAKTNWDRRSSKIQGAFARLGPAVFHGAVSTFIGTIPIAFADNYSLKAFFREWFGIIFFGMLHGFFLLPALLQLIGCLNKHDKAQSKSQELDNRA